MQLPDSLTDYRQLLLSFSDFAALDAAGADPNPLRRAVDQRLNSLQIHIPAPTRHVVRVRDVVSKLRPFAANVAYLCHHSTPELLGVSRRLCRFLPKLKPEPFGRRDMRPLQACRILSITASAFWAKGRVCPAAKDQMHPSHNQWVSSKRTPQRLSAKPALFESYFPKVTMYPFRVMPFGGYLTLNCTA